MRADAAVRPYTEDLSFKRHSKLRAKSCRGRIPRLPARGNDDQNAMMNVHPIYERHQQDSIDVIRLNSLFGRTRRSAPTRRICRHRNQIQQPARQRDAGWDVEREGREPKVSQSTKMEPVCTGDFGTSARHPPSERIDTPISKSLSREGVAALPYTETSMH